MQQNKIAQLQNCLLHWYRKSARDLPWRRTKDPYKIWVSEIMLQQTQVDTVIPYYEKWLRKFPSLKSLAKTPPSEVMKYWAGLGYYRRARMLHEAAKTVLNEYSGQVPNQVQELVKLPGIGKYTAGAIASIAFGQKAPIVDGNVIRILTRIFAVKNDIGKPATLQKIWAISESLVPETNPGDFNQAMMELGATVCTPDNPNCEQCPVSKICAAHHIRKETEFPVKKTGERLQKIRNVALVLRNGQGRVLLQKQPKEGRWGGLWMFPFWKEKKTMLQGLQLRSGQIRHLLTIRHGFTKYRVTLEVYEQKVCLLELKANHQKQRAKYGRQTIIKSGDVTRHAPSFLPDGRWLTPSELSKYALPSPHKKIASHLANPSGVKPPRRDLVQCFHITSTKTAKGAP
jgi:A/G-specific adenine glycosylase